MVVDHGRVIARGDARELKRQVGGAQAFVTVVDPARLGDVAEHRGRGSPARSPGSTRPPAWCIAPTEGGPRVVSRLADALADEGVEVEDIGLRQPSLDDVFLTLTGEHIAEDEPVEVSAMTTATVAGTVTVPPVAERRGSFLARLAGSSPGAACCTCAASPRRWPT